MAYGVKYRFPFQSVEGVDWTIDILKDGYSGSILTRAIGGSPILRRDKSDNICGTSLELTAECLVDGEFEELSSSNPFMFQVKVYHSNNGSTSELVWQGYVTPEIYNAPEVAPPYDVRVTATDGLGELKLNNFEAQGTKTLSAMLAYLLGFTGLSLGIRQASDLSCSAAAAGAVLSSVYINLDYLAGETCYDVLQRLLATIDSTITQDGSYWLIFKETGLSVNTTNYTFGYYENGVLKQRSILRYGSAATHPAGFWPVGKMNREYVAPKKKILITADNHYKKNIFGTWTLVGDAVDEGDYLSLPAAGDGMSQIVTFSEEIQKHLLLSIKVRNVGDGNDAGNLSISVKLSGSFYQASQYLYLTNSIGDRRRDNVAVTWSTNPAAKCTFEVQAPVESDTDMDYVTVELVIPLYHNSARSYVLASSLEIQVSNGDSLYPKRIYGITLSQYEQIKGLQKVVNIDNGSRGEAPDVEVAFAGTTGPNNYAGLEELLDGVPMTSAGAKITSWSSGAFSSLDFLSLIARDYALKYVSSRVRVNGTLQTNPDLKAVPVMFADDHDGEIYIVDTFSWDLYNDEQTVEMISRPAPSFDVESESVTPIDGTASSGGGSSSAGGWSSPGSGTSLLSVWRSLTNDSTIENYGSSTEIAAEHLAALFTVETLSGGGKYLRLNPQFVGMCADGWITAGGIQGGGGSGGVDLDRVWDSLTNNTDKPNVKINAAHIPVASASAIGGVKVDGTTITIQNGVISAVAQGGGGSVNSLTVGSTNYTPDSSGVITIPAYPTTLPASDVYSWAKAASKPSYNLSEIGNAGDIQAIEALTGTGFLKRTGADTWALDSSTYLTAVPKATDSVIGGFQTGYSESGKNYAVKMSGNKAYVNVPWTDTVYSLPLAANGTRGGIQIGFSESNSGSDSSRNYAVQLSSEKAYVNVPWTDTVYTHPTSGANTTITAANGKVLSAITVDNLGHVTSVSSKTLAVADIPDLSGVYLPLTGGTLTGNLRMKPNGSNYGSKLNFGDGDYVFLYEDTDDHLQIKGADGIELIVGSDKGIKFGDGVLKWDSTYNAWHLEGNFYADGFITAGGINGQSSILVTISGEQTITGAKTFSADATFSGRIGVGGAPNNAYALYVTGSQSLTGGLTVGGSATITSGLGVGTAWAGSSYKLVVSGTAKATAWDTSSDRRLKEGILSMRSHDAIGRLMQLKPVSWTWNELSGYAGKVGAGFVAQDVEEVIPQMVHDDGKFKCLDYTMLHAFEVAGFQDHERRIAELERENKELRMKLKHGTQQ